jgi:phage-related protein
MKSEGGAGEPVLRVVFFKSSSGGEPVREWLLSLNRQDRKLVGKRIKTVQYGWPIGMPVVRKLEPHLWEVMVRIEEGIARVLFTVDESLMVLLHGFVRKSARMPATDLRTARARLDITRRQA